MQKSNDNRNLEKYRKNFDKFSPPSSMLISFRDLECAATRRFNPFSSQTLLRPIQEQLEAQTTAHAVPHSRDTSMVWQFREGRRGLDERERERNRGKKIKLENIFRAGWCIIREMSATDSVVGKRR